MAGSSLFALLDDIATLLDDVASMTKVAAVKTAGVTGDDLAVSAEQLSGVTAARELPVVAAVAKGSLKNKAILIPATMGISVLSVMTGLPLVLPLLLIGGAYLCHEGVEKIFHKKTGHEDRSHKKMLEAAANDTLKEFERKKIKGAIRTDLVLSGEIMILALGTIATAPLLTQLAVMTTIGIGMTVFVYGLVAGIVKIDDLGLHMTKKTGDSLYSKAVRNAGVGILKTAPYLMKTLSVVGTVAMFMVGGSILTHAIPTLAALTHHLPALAATGAAIITGFAAGTVSMTTVHLCNKARKYLPRFSKPQKQVLPIPAPASSAEPANSPNPDLTPIMTKAAAPKNTSMPDAEPKGSAPSPVK